MATEIDRFLEAYPPEIRDLTNQARALVASVTPDATETLKIGWKVLWYGFGKKMAEQFAVIMPTKNHVSLGFSHGAELPDPSGRLEGEGKKIRHVKLRTSADLDDPAITTLLRVEVALARGGAGVAKTSSAARKTASRKKPAPRKKTVPRKRTAPRKKTASRAKKTRPSRSRR
jgi:hypothetical protein